MATVTASTDQLPLITIATTADFVAQLVIPHSDRAVHALLYRIAARAIEDERITLDSIRIQSGRRLQNRPVCMTLVVYEGSPEDAAEAAEVLLNAATEIARDASGFATHRIERK